MDDQKRLRKAVKELCEAGEKYKRGCSRFLKEECLDRCRLLKILADFLLEPDSTLTLANHVPYLLLELLFLASERQQHMAMSVALGKLVRFFPVVLGFSLQYFEKNANPFWDEENDEPVEPKRRRVGDSVISDLEIVQACCNLLEAKCDYFRLKWDWSLFMETYLDHAQEKVRWLAGRCLALVTGMTDSQQRHFELQLAEPGTVLYYRIEHQKPLNNAVQTQNFIVEEDAVIKTSRQVISVCGINLPVWKVECQQENDNFIMVDSTIANLRRLALGVASGRGIYLHGPVGSGKTSVVEHLAKLTGRIKAPDFVKVQLGDEMDSKMLLGTYRCTDVPGEFLWQPGILTQAVMGGYWILLEDVDSAAADVAVVLASLVETGTLSVPGYRDSVKAKPGFQLFVTQRLVASRHSKHQNIQHKHWLCIAIKPFSKEELVLVIEKMYPVLQTVATRMVEVFLLFSAGQHTNEETTQKIDLPARRRLTSTRDLMKWCARAVEGFNVASQESALKILQDAIDIFCLSVADSDSRLTLAVAVASHLGIVKSKAEYFCKDHKPVISLATTHISAGRTTLLRQSKAVSRRHSMAGRNFSLTRPAACLLENIACCVKKHEPALLVGETGTGKTTVVQHLAAMTGHQLIVINMNQQSDSADLLGGYKPVDFKHVVRPVREEFEQLFRKYFASQPNHTFLNNYMIFFNTGRWGPLIRAMRHVQSTALKQLIATSEQNPKANAMRKSWHRLGVKLHKLEAQLRTKSALAFTFIEGTLIKALQKGYWVLLDEINLASAETLECLSGLLEGSTGSLYLLERGDQEPVVRHPDFHLFACMNPATDVGKKDLPAGLRNRFTEFFVDELTDERDVIMLMNTYLQPISPSASRISSIVEFYLKMRQEASKKLTDGVGYRPHYSLRTLCRALIVGAQNKCGSVPRSLYEGLCLSFLSQLDHTSYPAVQQAISDKLFVGEEKKSVLKALLPQPAGGHGDEYINFEGYWVKRGKLEPRLNDKYILTSSVKRNLHDLVRVVALSDHPVLLQGETSVGKTSLITYLAAASGNVCVRINNHEHTDLQEYIGSYCANQTGQLVFKEGVLVEAMREGSWIILDELNLAPSDVLEALNRVLDDNRELFIPETQQTIKAHPQFRLFATQNPPGLYGGRKVLSRAFQNRFVELHFGEIPPNELVTILNIRCEMPQSYCRKLVEVMRKLQLRRRGSAAFAGKQGFMTLRDLFRWGERYRQAKPKAGQSFLDWEQYVADEGFLVLAGRVRRAEEAEVIKEVIEKQFKRKIDSQKLFTLSEETSPITRTVLENLIAHPLPGFEHVVWTFNMRRLAVLVGKAIELNEPVLLVGETGCGKTTLCQMLAAASNQTLYTVNCHMHTESADFLGGLRPVRDHSITDQKEEGAQKRLFEWVDGPLIKAMTGGDLFLADEISLADDSVLERLNSLLEPERTLLLAEKGGDTAQVVVAKESFQFIGTMNPGGDYGKKELSPALRNRFTEIWCEPVSQREDLFAIIEHNLKPGLSLGNQEDGSTGIGNRLLDFLASFKGTEVGKRLTLSMRDIMTWVNFINTTAMGDSRMGGSDIPAAYVNGACLTFLDSFGSGVTSSERPSTLKRLREASLRFLRKQVEMEGNKEADLIGKAKLTETCFGIHPFYIPRGTAPVKQDSFTFSTPTTKQNTVRVLRALQVNKPILLEGSPGTGKTSLVAAIAKIAGHHLVRINLSDQTDVSDLFGADLPVEGGQGGQFAWRDGPFLRALKAGHWILLDELNLASQSVLEGLNACLDHRGEVFVPELGRTFYIQSSSTKLFGTQNPLRQGGARRGLPQSFLNRFTQIFIDALTSPDLCLILSETFPSLPQSMICDMVKFNMRLAQEFGEHGSWGHRGRPWDMNLRDLTRWCQIVECSEQVPPGKSVSIIYIDRMRTEPDRMKVKQIYEEEMGQKYPFHLELPRFHVTPNMVYVGDVVLNRSGRSISSSNLAVLRQQFPVLRSLMRCVKMDWLTILVGPSGSGKTSVVQLLADLTGRELRVLCVNSAMDTCDILGGFEQVDCSRELDEIGNKVELHILSAIRNSLLNKDTSQASQLLQQLGKYWKITFSEEQNWEQRLEVLLQLLAKLPCGEEQQYIEQRLNILKNEIGPSSTSGGKFKWVDSILVKALRDGCWLLVDNVNLCSPAVLDRLNAVLEPGGQLTIGERGVDADGNLVTITPHPDFRLFLAMDPINGEISRAMRNRGVEIFLNEDLSQNVLDARALLAQQGLNQISLQDALLCVHRDVTQGRQNVEKISDLLRAAFLLCQNTLHGRDTLKSLQSTCSEVYQLENVTIKSTRSSLSAPPAPVSLSAHRVDSDSSLAMVYLQGSSLLNQDLLSEILPGLQTQLNITPHLVILLYECASFNDLTLRHHWLDTLVAKDKNIKKLSNTLYETVASMLSQLPQNSAEDISNLPWDLRHLPELVPHNYESSAPERLLTLLRFRATKVLLAQERVERKTLTVECYSNAAKEGQVREDITTHAAIMYFASYLDQFDVLLETLLKSSSVIPTQNCFYVFLWRFRLGAMGELPLMQEGKCTSVVVQEAISRLTVHYHWLFKWTIPVLNRMLNQDPGLKSSFVVRQFETTNKIIKMSLPNILSPLQKIGKLVRQLMGQPSPRSSVKYAELLLKLARISDILNIWQEDKPSWKSCVGFLSTRKGVQAWETIVSAYSSLLPDGNVSFTEVESSLTEVENDLEVLKSDHSVEDFTALQLWPLRELVVLLLSVALRRELFEHKHTSVVKENLKVQLCGLSSIPATLAALLSMQDGKISMELLYNMLQHQKMSPATKHPKIWVTLDSETDEDRIERTYSTEREETMQTPNPLHSPALTVLATQLLLPCKNQLEYVVTLGSLKARICQLSRLKLFLWRNMSSLTSDLLNYRQNETSSAVSCCRKLLGALNRAALNKETEPDIDVLMKALLKDGNKQSKEFCEILSELYGAMSSINESITVAENGKWLIQVGQIWALLGYLQVIMYTTLYPIDPVEKKTLKLQYVQKEITQLQTELQVQELQSSVLLGVSLEDLNESNVHPHIKGLKMRLNHLQSKEKGLEKSVAVRPTPPQYSKLSADILHYAQSLASREKALNLCNQLIMVAKQLCDPEIKIKAYGTARQLLLETQSWQGSHEGFCSNLHSEHLVWYPDIILPILTAATTLSHGIKLLVDAVEKLMLPYAASINGILTSLIHFPSQNSEQLLNDCTALLHQVFVGDESDKSIILEYRLLKAYLRDQRNIAIVQNEFEEKPLEIFFILIKKIAKIWKQEEDERVKLEKEKQSLYVIRCAPQSEEQKTEDEIEQLFPSLQSKDFYDFEQSDQDLEESVKHSSSTNKIVELMNREDAEFIARLHSQIMTGFTYCHWLVPKVTPEARIDFVRPLLERFQVFSALLEKISTGADSSVDLKLQPSIMVITSAELNFAESGEVSFVGNDMKNPSRSSVQETRSQKLDFYHDSNINEAKSCLPVLNALTSRVQELLHEWPQHPTLMKIWIIVKRILAFPLTSPLARFQTGMELLLAHIYEWEENAHSGVSIATHLTAVSSLIATWRKLQLQSWRDCLSGVQHRFEQGAAKWWLYLYSVIEDFVNVKPEEEPITSKDILEGLVDLMEKSSLGEFNSRLSLLLSFHCHVQHMQSSTKQNELMLLLWNVHKYYEQFSQTVNVMIDEQKAPIEKKLKDCVKIFRWEDKNYWTVKETIKKVHKTLHKHIKEYQAVLNQSVCLAVYNYGAETIDTSTGIRDRPQRNLKQQYKSLMTSKSFLSSRKQKTKFQAIGIGSTTGLLSKSEKYFLKALDLSQSSIEGCPYGRLTRSTEALVGTIIETYQEQSRLSVPDCDSASEHSKKAKECVRQRRNNLNILFSTLRKLGLSYRTGIVKWHSGEDLTTGKEIFMLPPIALNVSLTTIPGFKQRRISKDLSNSWKGCEMYFQRSLARLKLLKSALQNPSKDIGHNEIEKCWGFSLHLMSLVREQKIKLAETTKMLVFLRCHATQLCSILDPEPNLPSQHFIQEWIKRLKDLLALLMLYLEQLWVLLNACPSKCSTEELPVLSLSQLPPMLQSQKGDSIWSSTLDKVHTLAAELGRVRNELEKSETTPSFFRKEQKTLLLSSSRQLKAIESGYTKMKSLATTVAEIRKTFECEPTEKSTIVVELTLLEQRMFSEAEEFNAALLNQSDHDGEYVQADIDDFRVELEILIMKTLSGIEVLYKEFACDAMSSGDETDADEEKTELKSELEPNHLVEHLVESMFNVFPKLGMKVIEKQLCIVTARLQRLLNNAEQRNLCKRMLTNYLPCLDQLLLLHEFLVTQQVGVYRVSVKLLSILLVIFINLVQKGFCIPAQKTEKDTRESKSSGGMGLAEGEGDKDVSERIESEDQLEEAKSKDAEKEQQDDKDCKEEDGIQMSEDFEGKIQDTGNKEEEDNEQSEEEEDKEDMDKEMGDTAEGADTLDSRIWGLDSEEEDEESDPKEGEAESGKGEETGESEIVSKSKQEPANEEEPSGQEEKQKKKDINEMNEDGDGDDDQVNPYHGQMEPQQEPDPLDLPEDMQLDEGEKPEDEGEGEDTENPFDIDTMKEHKPPEPDSESKEDESNTEEKEENIGDENESVSQDEKLEETDNWKEEKEDESEIGKKDEHKAGEVPKEEENNQEMAQPSVDESTAEPAEKAEDMNKKFGSRDKVKGEDQKEEEIKGEEASGEVGDKEQQGVGQSQMQEESEAGHSGKAAAAALSTDSQPMAKQLEKRPSKGETRDDRTLGDDTGPLKKRLRMLNMAAEEEEEKEEEAKEAEWYQHIKETKDKSYTQAMDAATKEQAEEQLGQWSKEEEDLKENEKEEEDINMQDEDMEQVFNKTRTGRKTMEIDSLEDAKEKDIKEEDFGEMVETLGAARGSQESAYYTSIEQDTPPTAPDMHAIRNQLEQQLATWNQPPPDSEAQKIWEEFSTLTLPLARDLSEQLRLVLEPTRASRLKGDYRTGKRINMRKVIPYIASEFRKDKIWLRRTKPSKREYQIVIAIDDSSSMADSHSKELAFESLALVTKALTLVEAGELAVVNFGEATQVLHPLGETFTEQNGAKLLQQLSFGQKATNVGQLVTFATAMLANQRSQSGDRPAQLLIIVSDGRGVRSEGPDAVQQAVRYAKHAGVLMVFIIIDSPANKDSILELQSVDIIDGKPAISSYLDNFPFPYYMILKDISALPAVLSDALRQWFELIANTDSC